MDSKINGLGTLHRQHQEPLRPISSKRRRFCSPLLILAIIGSLIILYFRCKTKSSSISDSSSLKGNAIPSAVESRLKVSEDSYQNYVKKRKLLVKNPSDIQPWSMTGKNIYFWDYFLPTFSCPHGIDRVGTLGDGGKFVCGLELFNETSKPCLVYSFGVSTESSFEAQLLEETNCDIYAYDGSVNNMGPQISNGPSPRVHFNKSFVGVKENRETKTLGSIMRTNGHKWVDILKLDIEGAEIELLDQVMDEFDLLPFGQMQIEIHGDPKGEIFPRLFELWERMEVKGLRAFKNEINYYPCVRGHQNAILMEYSFINIRGDHRLIS